MYTRTFTPSSLLRTNRVPSPKEREVIESLILLHQERSLALDAEVKLAEDTLHDLRLEQRVQRNLLAAHQALLTPMRRLIPDLLLEIFRHCHEDARDMPMRLARVCRQWRELALSTPTFWTVVTLHGALPTPRIVPFARACADHSGSCGLRVIISLMNKRSEMQRARRALLEALQILAQHGHRWRSFEVVMDKAYRPESNEIMISSAPRLEKLVWVINDVRARLPFTSFSNLRDFRPFMLHPLDLPLVLQCTELRNFVTNGPRGDLTLEDCWTILSNCPSLETFDVAGIKASQTDLTHKGPITLHYLRELRIGPFVPDPAPLVHRLNMPSLTRLRLLVGKSMEFDSSCIRRLVHDCQPPLTNLSLVNANCADVASCLPLLPHLKSLLLQQASAVDLVILRLLERDDAGHFVCPQLEHLGLRLCLFSGAQLVELASARRSVAGGFRVLIGDKPRYQEGEFEGLTIELNLVGEFSDTELEELRGLQTTDGSGEVGMD